MEILWQKEERETKENVLERGVENVDTHKNREDDEKHGYICFYNFILSTSSSGAS